MGQFLSGYLAYACDEERNLMLNLSGFSDLEEFDTFFEGVYGKIELEDTLKNRIIEEVYARKEKLLMVPYEVDKAMLAKIVNYGKR